MKNNVLRLRTYQIPSWEATEVSARLWWIFCFGFGLEWNTLGWENRDLTLHHIECTCTGTFLVVVSLYVNRFVGRSSLVGDKPETTTDMPPDFTWAEFFARARALSWALCYDIIRHEKSQSSQWQRVHAHEKLPSEISKQWEENTVQTNFYSTMSKSVKTNWSEGAVTQ